jgi:sec-independent protein translocase protein TatB
MFEVGFTELLLISVIALVVLGPERLPKLVGQVGRWVGKARAMARQFREQLESEVNLDEMTRTTPKSSTHSTPAYPPAGEAPPNEPSMSDSLSSAHTTAAAEAEAAASAAADTAHHPTSDYPYAEPSPAPVAEASSYHPEADVYSGSSVPDPERITVDEEPAAVAAAETAGSAEAPARLHDPRV